MKFSITQAQHFLTVLTTRRCRRKIRARSAVFMKSLARLNMLNATCAMTSAVPDKSILENFQLNMLWKVGLITELTYLLSSGDYEARLGMLLSSSRSPNNIYGHQITDLIILEGYFIRHGVSSAHGNDISS